MNKGMTKAERAEVLADLNRQIRKAAELANKQMDNFLFSSDIPVQTREEARNNFNQRVYQSEHRGAKASETPDWVSTGYRPRFSGRKAKSIMEARNRLERIEQVRRSYYSKRARADYVRSQREYWGEVFGLRISKSQWDTVREVFDAVRDSFQRAHISSEEALQFCAECAVKGIPVDGIIDAAEAIKRNPALLNKIMAKPQEWQGIEEKFLNGGGR